MSEVGFQFSIGTRPTCLICGDERDVRMGMMRFVDLDENGHQYANGWRCRDHGACRGRFESDNPGRAFPLDETRSRIAFVGEDPA